MTTQTDAIAGLIERLKGRLGPSRTVTVGPGLYEDVSESATAIDSLLKERDALQSLAKELSDALLACRPLGGSELFIKRFGQHYADPVYCKAAIEQSHKDRHEAQKGLIRYRRQAEKAEQERDALQARVKELEDGWDVYDTHTRLWKIEHDRKLEAAEARATRLQQELDDEEERGDKATRRMTDLSNQVARLQQERDEAYELAAGRWKPVGFGWGDIYEVSSLGHVRRIGSNALIGTVSGNGYVRVQLSRAGTSETFLIHKLVADAFIGPRPDGHQIDHINGVRDDNRFVNLRYCSPQQNISYTIERGANAVADRNGAAVLTADQVHAIRQAKKEGGRYWGAARIAQELGVHESTVQKAASGRYYSAIRIRRLAGPEKEGE